MADDSDSSGLSEHSDKEIQKLAPIFVKAKKATKLVAPPPAASPPRPKRAPSPPHEDVFADNPDIAVCTRRVQARTLRASRRCKTLLIQLPATQFIVMFRSRFNDALPSKLPHYGPQDIETGVMDGPPSPQVQQLLCALLALVLNRKKPVEYVYRRRRASDSGRLVGEMKIMG